MLVSWRWNIFLSSVLIFLNWRNCPDASNLHPRVSGFFYNCKYDLYCSVIGFGDGLLASFWTFTVTTNSINVNSRDLGCYPRIRGHSFIDLWFTQLERRLSRMMITLNYGKRHHIHTSCIHTNIKSYTIKVQSITNWPVMIIVHLEPIGLPWMYLMVQHFISIHTVLNQLWR